MADPLLDDPVALTAHLVAIDSVNPSLVPDAVGEAPIAAVLARLLADAGCEVTLLEAVPGRPSIVARLRGSGGGRTLMLNGHLDTVGLGGIEAPLTARIEGGRLWGRGALDMKAGVALMIVAALRAHRRGLRGDVLLACVADEEHSSIGSYEVARTVTADAAIVTEPTRERLTIAHKGFVWAEIETAGTAAHGSRPDLGVDAIAAMGATLVGVGRLADDLAAGSAHPLLGCGSLHASLIDGGSELSTYPSSCRLQLERRTLPGEDGTRVAAELRRIAPHATVTITLEREPFEVARDAEIVTILAGCAHTVLGHEPELVGAPYWTDAAALAAAGIPTVLFGPSGEGEHADEEWVELASIERCTSTLEATIAEFCR